MSASFIDPGIRHSIQNGFKINGYIRYTNTSHNVQRCCIAMCTPITHKNHTDIAFLNVFIKALPIYQVFPFPKCDFHN